MLDLQRDVLPYLRQDKRGLPPPALLHGYYRESLRHRDELRAAFGKVYPDYLDINRPKEKKDYKKYRRDIYGNPFMGLRKRLVKVLNYIKEADDFEVLFPDQPDAPDPNDTLEDYCEMLFGSDDGAVDWFFRAVRPLYVDDPNAVLVVLPIDQPMSNTLRVKPRVWVVPCEKVYMHRRDKFAVLELPERKVVEATSVGVVLSGRTLLFLDHDSYCVAREKDSQIVPEAGILTNWELDGVSVDSLTQETYFNPPKHGCPAMPAVKIGQVSTPDADGWQRPVAMGSTGLSTTLRASDLGEEFYESVLTEALPFVKAGQQAQNDIAIEAHFHVASQEWRYYQRKCTADGCVNGLVAVRDKTTGEIIAEKQCPTCKGAGYQGGSGTDDMMIVSPPTATLIGDEGRPVSLPTPPGGFIPRPIEPLQEFVKEFERMEGKAYSEINMRFLQQVPQTSSGTSKAMDRQELYRELNTQAAHLCGLMEQMFDWMSWQRYGTDEAAPEVLTPVRFDLENAELTRVELATAKKDHFDPLITGPLEKKLIGYQTGEDSAYYQRYELKERLDPMPGKTLEEKSFTLAMVKLINAPGSPELQLAVEEMILSIYLDGLLILMLQQYPNFAELTVEQQREKLMAEARKRVSAQKAPVTGPDGKPVVGTLKLDPIINVKNYHQLG